MRRTRRLHGLPAPPPTPSTTTAIGKTISAHSRDTQGREKVLQISRGTDTTPNSRWTSPQWTNPTRSGQQNGSNSTCFSSMGNVEQPRRSRALCTAPAQIPGFRRGSSAHVPSASSLPSSLGAPPPKPAGTRMRVSVAGLPTPPGSRGCQVCRQPSRKLSLTFLGLTEN